VQTDPALALLRLIDLCSNVLWKPAQRCDGGVVGGTRPETISSREGGEVVLRMYSVEDVEWC